MRSILSVFTDFVLYLTKDSCFSIYLYGHTAFGAYYGTKRVGHIICPDSFTALKVFNFTLIQKDCVFIHSSMICFIHALTIFVLFFDMKNCL